MGEARSNDVRDEALLEGVASSDRAALRTLYERHAPWLVAWGIRRFGIRGRREPRSVGT